MDLDLERLSLETDLFSLDSDLLRSGDFLSRLSGDLDLSLLDLSRDLLFERDLRRLTGERDLIFLTIKICREE